jgi:hypothetical protein
MPIKQNKMTNPECMIVILSFCFLVEKAESYFKTPFQVGCHATSRHDLQNFFYL